MIAKRQNLGKKLILQKSKNKIFNQQNLKKIQILIYSRMNNKIKINYQHKKMKSFKK